jgi:hypothetical protein
MLKQIDSPRKDTLVYELDGYVTKKDIKSINNSIELTLSRYDTVNLMIYLNIKKEGFNTLFKEFQLGGKYSKYIRKIAFISDKKYCNLFVFLNNISTKYKKKYFDLDHIANAWNWIEKGWFLT